ncbi:unnamed protein product [Ranitomeya imitator]|uniref:Secretory carrier-associated membrane protein n=1 Tax=Ranitomeya imitator TaxID=111125 RepID=A0ABN9MT68_9NEOB|nr:unnamed protein product [Ranitomeya imitator]
MDVYLPEEEMSRGCITGRRQCDHVGNVLLENTFDLGIHEEGTIGLPLPSNFPVGPCFYQDFSVDIPVEFQKTVKIMYYLWMFHTVTLFVNIFGCLAWFCIDTSRGVDFGLAILWFLLFTPCSFVCWYRPLYGAFSNYSGKSLWISRYELSTSSHWDLFLFLKAKLLQLLQDGNQGYIGGLSTALQNAVDKPLIPVAFAAEAGSWCGAARRGPALRRWDSGAVAALFPHAQSNRLCEACDSERVQEPPTASSPVVSPAPVPQADAGVAPPEWVTSLSQSMASLTEAIKSLQTPAVGTGNPPVSERASGSQESSACRGRALARQTHGKRNRKASPRHSGASASWSSVSRSPSPAESGEVETDYESEGSLNFDKPGFQESVDSLIEAVNQSLGIVDELTSSSDHKVSFKRTKRAHRVFSSHPEFEDLIRRNREHPDKRFSGQRALKARYPFASELCSDWAENPSVDPPVSRLASNTLLSLPNGSSIKDPTDRLIESLARSFFEASSSALFPSFAATWVARAMISWSDSLSKALQEGNVSAELAEMSSQVAMAGSYLINASLDAADCASSAASNAIAIRRALWLRSWRADSTSKKSLTSLPYQGGRLFGEKLDQLISDSTGGKSKFLPQQKARQPFRRQFQARFRTFRYVRWAPASGSPAQGRPNQDRDGRFSYTASQGGRMRPQSSRSRGSRTQRFSAK